MLKQIGLAAALLIFSTLASAASAKGHSVCYGEACLKTVSAKKIADKAEYRYLDPILFPHESLREQYRKPLRFIDLESVGMDQPLSKNFAVGDFMAVERGRYALFSPTVAEILQLIRDEVGRPIMINSGYRSPGHNSQTGGSALWSRHMYGDAVDFTVASANYQQLQRLCRQHGASFTLIYKAHIHCDWRLLPLAGEFYDAAKVLAAPELTSIVADEMASQAELEIRTTTSNTITIAAEIAQLEDEGDTPIFEWNVVLPDQRMIEGFEPEITLPKTPGHYIINVKIGGTIAITRRLDL